MKKPGDEPAFCGSKGRDDPSVGHIFFALRLKIFILHLASEKQIIIINQQKLNMKKFEKR